MSMRLAVAALLLATAISGGANARSATQDWNRTYAETGKGHRVGNPAAPVQLVEFVSYSCPHCASYAQASESVLRVRYIGAGKAAVEVRHVIRNRIDLAAALVTECGPAEQFFARHSAMMLAHNSWMRRASSATEAQRARWQSGTIAQQMQAIAGDLGFRDLMEPQGLSAAEINACLADTARAQAIADASAANSDEFAVPGTPSFVINGALLEDVHSWESLQPLLEASAN